MLFKVRKETQTVQLSHYHTRAEENMYVLTPYPAMSLLTAYSAAALEELEQPANQDKEPGLPRSSIQPTDSWLILQHLVSSLPKMIAIAVQNIDTYGAPPTTAPNLNDCILSHLLCFLKSRKDYPKIARILVMDFFNTANKKLRCFDKHTFIHLREFRTGAWTSLSLLLSIHFMLAYVKWQKAKKFSVYSNKDLKSAWEHLRSAQDPPWQFFHKSPDSLVIKSVLGMAQLCSEIPSYSAYYMFANMGCEWRRGLTSIGAMILP
ncbi:hypothetical protein SI65_01960 [Aspergillus cristatus]|uniref:Uncharacterized protein n=1 Tax=Aspergillus cristatus TaxID=573508 RepID=A0A1E3BTN2_ASPCR|nr:hypothetical protein SI65_01922 [Aspergillus cristatus]ODM24370.1 hypothetical protein SI65_01960 [Aspergillus cristatus]